MQQPQRLNLLMATRTSKLAAAWTISRFIPKWRTLVTILFFFASFCVGGVCGILAERKEAARLQALFFDKQKKLSQNVPNRTGESELNPDVSHEDEEQRDEAEQWQDVNGVETEETSKSSFAEFNVGWSRHTREKRVNKMLQEAHVVFISRGLEELRSIFEAFSPDPGSAVVAEAAGAFTGPLPLPSSNAHPRTKTSRTSLHVVADILTSSWDDLTKSKAEQLLAKLQEQDQALATQSPFQGESDDILDIDSEDAWIR